MFDLDKLLQDNSSLDFFKLIEQLFFSIVLIGIVFGVRLFILIIIKRRLNNRSALLRWRLSSMYIALFCTLWLLLPLWISSLRGVLAILGIFGAGVLIVLKELILNIAGWFYIVLRRPFTMGNRIVINEMTGDVIEIRLLDFSMIEVNPRSEGGQSTGRIIHVPNSQ
ncbi:MAG: mechanosensitive ion channel, partial [Leptospiraceae bacterium]|nr:mechanosensitive ion channel [Leptospiraceae bacterium]